MTPVISSILLTVGLAVLAVVGDYYLKLAGKCAHPFNNKWFIIGLVFYAISAFGAVFVFKHIKMATVGAIYCVSLAILLTVVGTVFFKEVLHPKEIVGLCLALASLYLLSRFTAM